MTLLWRKFLECSSSPCSLRHPCDLTHSYGGRFWSVLPHCSLRYPCVLTHFVIPVFSHPWLVFSPISSLSLTSLSSHLTQVIPDYSLPSLVLPLIPYSVFSHTPTLIALTKSSHRHPWLLTPITCATMLTHPRLFSHHSYYHSLTRVFSHWVFSHPSSSLTTHSHHSSHTHSLIPAFSLTSLLWVLTPITCLLTLTISHRVSPHALSHPSHLCHHTEWSHITCVLRECLFPLPWCRTTTKSTLTLSSLSHTLPLMSSLWTLPWCRTTTKSTHSLLWEDLCSHSHSHGVVLPPSLPTHCSERTCAPTHTSMVSYYHQVYPLTLTLSSLSHTLPWCRTTTKSSHTHTNPCAPTHSHVLTHSAPLTSFHLILTTNSSQLIPHTLPPIMPPSHHHHLITSSYHQPPPIASSHSIQFIPPLSITPNPPNRLLNPLQSQFIPITTIVAPHRLPNNIKPIQSRRWDKPQGLAGQSQLIPSQYPLHTKSSTKDCTDNTISFNTIQIVFLYPKRIKYSYVKYILSL